MPNRVEAEALLQALVGGAIPKPGDTIVFNRGDDSDGFPWGFGVPESSGIYISVKASPNVSIGNGSVDDTATLQATIDLVSSLGGGVVFFPEGTYLHSGLTLKSNVTLMGTGWKSILKLIASTNGDGIVLEGINTERVGLIDLAIDGNKANQSSGNGVVLTNTSGSWSQVGPRHLIRNLLVHDCQDDGLVLTDADWSQITVYSSDNGSDGLNLVADFCNILLQAEGNGAYGLNLGTAADNLVILQATGNSSGAINGTKDKNSIIFDHDFRLAGFFNSVIGTDGSSTDQHFLWGKDGSLSSGNPLYDICTSADSVAKSQVRGNDSVTLRIFVTFDYENALIKFGEDGAVHMQLPSFTDANRGAAGTAGRVIWNTDDGEANYDDGANWIDWTGATT